MACNFCKIAVAENGKRMKDHTICKKCPDEIKVKYTGTVKQCSYPPLALPPTSSSDCQSNHSGIFGGCGSVYPGQEPSQTVSASSYNIPAKNSVRRCSTGTFADRIMPAEQDDIDTALARAIFASGAPLSMTEHVFWQAAFKKLRPAYSLPSQ